MIASSLDAPTLGAVPHADGLMARLACARAKAAGIALAPLLRKANLTLQQIDDSRLRLAARDQIQLLNLIADAMGDDLLGAHLAAQCDLREMGLIYYVLASSETVLDALRRAVRYAVLANEGAFGKITRRSLGPRDAAHRVDRRRSAASRARALRGAPLAASARRR